MGACKQRTTKLSKRDQRVKKFCCHFADGKTCTLYAPKAARGWLSKRGVRKGECENETGPDLRLRLLEGGDDNTIIGHTWKSLEIFVKGSNTLEPTLDDHPITISFDSSTKVYGNTGCNNCFGNLALFTDIQFHIPWLATTKMFCHPQERMDQEFDVINLMTNRTFFYEVFANELQLFETVGEDGNEFKGDLLARFIRDVE